MSASQVVQLVPKSSQATKEISFDVGEDGKGSLITPKMASEMLERIIGVNRKDSHAVDAYAAAMAAGAWIMNAMPIILDPEGRVLDGVQRLEACVKANTPFRTAIARNVRADTLHTMDQHRQRSYQNILESRGYPHPGILIRMLTKLIHIEEGTLNKAESPINWSRFDRVLTANEDDNALSVRDSDLVRAIEYAFDYTGHAILPAIRSIVGFMALRAGHAPDFRKFLDAIASNAAMNEPGGEAARMLRVTIETARRFGRIETNEMIAFTIQAFNDFLSDRRPEAGYSWSPDYGNIPLTRDGKPIDRMKMIQFSPPNLGFPLVDGYPGLPGSERSPSDMQFANPVWHGSISALRNRKVSTSGRVGISFLSVTPEVARGWLEKYNRSNRKIQMSHVGAIARDIMNGNWQQNAQPICFAGDPFGGMDDAQLLNGQHRLKALIQASEKAEDPTFSVEVPIAINVPSEAFTTYDIHSKKTTLRGSSVDTRVMMAAARLYWERENSYSPGMRMVPSSSELLDITESHRLLGDATLFAQARKLISIASGGIMLYFISRIHEEDPLNGPDFLKELETGTGITKENPLARARTLLISGRKGRNRRTTLNALEKAWKDWSAWRRSQNL